jgi:hypothetical protein
MRNLIERNLQGRKVLILFLLTNGTYLIMLTITIPLVMSYSADMKLLDMMPTGYTHEYVGSLLTALGEKGRHAYLFNQLPFDMLYPGLFAISYSLVLAYFLKGLDKLRGNLFYLCLLPVFSGLFDYSENIGIISMLNSFPENSILLSQFTNVFSILKSTFTSIYFVSLIAILIWWIISKMRNRQN